jgi:RNA polymerase sigma factor (sigma-70 family)
MNTALETNYLETTRGDYHHQHAPASYVPQAPRLSSHVAQGVRTQFTTEERDALFASFRPLVQRLIRKYGDNAEMRKDLEGEIFCLFSGLLEAYDPARGVPLHGYLVHQLTCSVYTFVRRRWRQEGREVSLEMREEAGSAIAAPQATIDPTDEWDEAMAMEQVRKMLPTAIAQLPLRQRQVVVWRYFEHRSFEEIAEALGGVQVATTRSLLRHGMNSLRRAFEKASLSLDGE